MTLRFLNAGESHGPAHTVIIEGIPAGLSVSGDMINAELKKRMHDAGRGGRGKIESDQVTILSGIRHGKTLGSPICLMTPNDDYANWKDQMGPNPPSHKASEGRRVTNPRPGHADLTGVMKYGFDDVRNVLERASARETVSKVAAGAIFKLLLKEIGVEVASHTVQWGPVRIKKTDYTFEDVKKVFAEDPLTRCVDPSMRQTMADVVQQARDSKDTLGGVVEIIAHGVPPGLGSYVQQDRKLDGRIAGALMSVASVKAVEIGNAIDASSKTGKEVQDAIYVNNKQITRKTNNMGGLEGGMSNGEDIVVRTYWKPLSTLFDPLPTVDIATGEQTKGTMERTDTAFVGRGGVMAEAMLAYVLADAALEKFGGDSIAELKRNFEGYKTSLPFSIK